MATFFSVYTSSSLILLLLLLSLTTIHRSDAAPLDDVCGQTEQPQRCITLIQSSVEGSERSDLPKLGQDVILAALTTAGNIKMKVDELYSSERDPNLKSIYLNCLDLYRSTLDELLLSPNYLKLRQYNKVRDAAVVARRGVSGCAAAVSYNGGLRRGIDDTGIMADAIAIVAQKLQS